MHYELTPRGKLTVFFTPADRKALGLPAERTHQIMTNHWKGAVLWLIEKGIPLEKGLKWLRRGSGYQCFWRVNRVNERHANGTCFSATRRAVDRACGSYRAFAFGGQ